MNPSCAIRDNASSVLSSPPIFALFITFRTGYVQVVTYPTAFDRALAMIQYADQPVVLRMQDYA